ncbi:MAG: TrkA family potassium uptake protein [Bacillota bacterium]|nr:TrkA family potassium uptake protein [Bacillota bacterium]
MAGKQYLVVGLGRFGTSVARTLYNSGNDVLAIDKNEEAVNEISEHVTQAVTVNATDETSLKAMGIGNFDVAIVSIGTDVQSSIMAVLLLKELGVKYIIAKAHDDLHGKVLRKIGADRVVFAERDMGMRVAHNLVSSNILDYIELSPSYGIVETLPPKGWHGKSLNELNVRSKFGINIIAIKRGKDVNVSPTADEIIGINDILVVVGGTDELEKLENMVKG